MRENDTRIFKNTDHLISVLMNEFVPRIDLDGEMASACIVAKYDELIKILNAIIKNTDLEMRNIRLEEPDIDGYYDAWILSIDYNKEIWVEKATYNGQDYIKCGNSIVLLHEDVNSKFLIKNSDSEIICFGFDPEHKENNCDSILAEDGEAYGFTASKSDGNAQMWCSFYSTSELSKDDYMELLRSFGFIK